MEELPIFFKKLVALGPSILKQWHYETRCVRAKPFLKEVTKLKTSQCVLL